MESIPENIFTAVAEILVEILDVDPEEVTPEASFIDDLGADSLDTILMSNPLI